MNEQLVLNSNNELDAYAWPGGYPIYYLDNDNAVLCPKCATEAFKRKADGNEFSYWPVVSDVNWEDASLQCENCYQRIESAYAEDESGESK